MENNYLKVYLSTANPLTDNPVADLDNAANEQIIREVNGQFVLMFECSEHEFKSEYIVEDNIVIADDNCFDIKYYEQDHTIDGKVNYIVEAWHVMYRLKEITFDSYVFNGTPTDILNNFLNGTGFSVGTIDYPDTMTFAVNEETNALELLFLLAGQLSGEIDFTNKGFEVNLLNTIGQNNGFEIRTGKNIKGIKRTVDKRSGTSVTTYSVDILELKNSTEYIKKGLQDLEVIEIGDTVYLIDDDTGLDTTNRIKKITYNPRYRKNLSVDIANIIEFFTDKVTKIQRSKVGKDKLYYGASIGPGNGFESIRSDKKARAKFNADTLAMQVGDGTGDNWTDAVAFDPVSGKYKFVGAMTIESGSVAGVPADVIAGWNYTGKTTIDGGMIETDSVTALQIQVDDLSAISANLGTVTAGTITGVTITGSYINTLYDARVGNTLTIGDGSDPFPSTKTIQFFDDIDPINEAYITAKRETDNYPNVSIYAAQIELGAWDGIKFSQLPYVQAESSVVATRTWVESQNYAAESWVTSNFADYIHNHDLYHATITASGVPNTGLDIIFSGYGVTIRRPGTSDSITLPWDSP